MSLLPVRLAPLPNFFICLRNEAASVDVSRSRPQRLLHTKVEIVTGAIVGITTVRRRNAPDRLLSAKNVFPATVETLTLEVVHRVTLAVAVLIDNVKNVCHLNVMTVTQKAVLGIRTHIVEVIDGVFHCLRCV